MIRRIAGIDVHKRVVMAVVVDSQNSVQRIQLGTTLEQIQELKRWLQQQGVEQVVMESTAQYWRPVWLGLEGSFELHLAQAWSNRAPRGKKTDFKDAERLGRRFLAGELTLSLVPDAEQRQLRSLTRRRTQLTRDRVRIHNQVESLLEEAQIKLSSVLTDLFGKSGRLILAALAEGGRTVEQLVDLGDQRLKCSKQELASTLQAAPNPIQQRLLRQHLDQLQLIDQQLAELEQMTSEAFKPQAEAIARLSEVPGIRVLAAEQIVAEVGPSAASFPSPQQLSSWAGVCPGRQESAGKNQSSHSTPGNVYLRSALCQAAQAAVRTGNSFFQLKFKRLLPRLGYVKAIWAIARHLTVVIWKILHHQAHYIEYGGKPTPQALKRRLQRVTKELRKLGFSALLTPLTHQAEHLANPA